MKDAWHFPDFPSGNHRGDGEYHSLSLSTASALGGAGKPPQPCFISKESTQPKSAPLLAASTCSQLLHPHRSEPGSANHIFLDLFSFFFFFLFFTDTPNQTGPMLTFGQSYVMTVLSHSQITILRSCTTRYLEKRKSSFFL